MVELTAIEGVHITLSEGIHGTCFSCGIKRDVTEVQVHPDQRDDIQEWPRICGSCLAGALAVRLLSGIGMSELARYMEIER